MLAARPLVEVLGPWLDPFFATYLEGVPFLVLLANLTDQPARTKVLHTPSRLPNIHPSAPYHHCRGLDNRQKLQANARADYRPDTPFPSPIPLDLAVRLQTLPCIRW